MNNDHAHGKMDEVKGKAKNVVGDITGNKSTSAEGTVDRVKGAVKNAVGDLKDKAAAVGNEVKHKVEQLKK